MPIAVKPYPFNRVSRVSRSGVDLAADCGLERWRQRVEETSSSMARRLGLGSAEVSIRRVEALRLEQLRVAFPGDWKFAVFAQPTTGRRGFLGIDPLLAARTLARLDSRRDVLPGWALQRNGDQGAITWVLCAGLLEMSERDPAWEGWRCLGWFESVGQLGRSCGQEELLIGSWLSIQAGWDPGFAVWLEPGGSVARRSEQPRSNPDWDRLAPVALRLRWQVGQCELRVGELQVLEVGDVILLDQDHPDSPMTARVGSWRLIASRTEDGGAMRVEQIEREAGGVPMSMDPVRELEGANEEQLAGVLELPVTLAAEAGRVDLTVARLASLRAGDVITLPQALLGPIELRAGDRLIARGELVDVEGRRGVRITETGWRPGAADEAAA